MRGGGNSHVYFFADSPGTKTLRRFRTRGAREWYPGFMVQGGRCAHAHFFLPRPSRGESTGAVPAILALLGPRLRPLRTEAAGPEQPAHVSGMIEGRRGGRRGMPCGRMSSLPQWSITL